MEIGGRIFAGASVNADNFQVDAVASLKGGHSDGAGFRERLLGEVNVSAENVRRAVADDVDRCHAVSSQ